MKPFGIRAGLIALCALLSLTSGRAMAQLTPADIDKAIRAEWKKEKITPAPLTDDARFLRRIYLDIAGTLPPPEEVTAFLENKSKYKRLEAINKLLESPRYVQYWTNYWDDVLLGKQVRAAVVDRVAFKEWLTEQFRKNTPYNKFVYELLTATGQNSPGGGYGRAVGLKNPPPGMAMEMEAGAASDAKPNARINGAVNWYLKYAQTPADFSGNVSRIFLGVQIQCAQCHDHKTEKWTQEDFRRFTSCFMQTRPIPLDMGRDVKGIRRLEVRDINSPFLRRRPLRNNGKVKEDGRAEYANAIPAALDGADFSDSPNRRQALAAWITNEKNPWFAKAIVNRMWGHFMGRGFVDPVDDFRESNPTTMPALLDRLAQDFTEQNYDLKHLIRTICSTRTYQLAPSAAKGDDHNNTLWARYRLKPMGPDVLLDSLIQATGMNNMLENERLEAIRFAIRRQFVFLFDVDEETEQKEFEGTISQALLLLNGSLISRGTSLIPGMALAETMQISGDDKEKITALYLRTLSRKPTAKELAYWEQFVNAPREVVQTDTPTALPLRGRAGNRLPQAGKAASGNPNQLFRRRNMGADPLGRFAAPLNRVPPTPKQQAYEDVFWALLNSSEFIFNH
jgi:hypothetical protein